MKSLITLVVAVFSMLSRAAYFGPAHALLPRHVRVASFGFIAMASAFFASTLIRYVAVEDVGLVKILVGQGIYFGLLLLMAGSTRAAELTLYLAASAGVDLTMALLQTLGLDASSSSVRYTALAWEYGAALVAIARYHHALIASAAQQPAQDSK